MDLPGTNWFYARSGQRNGPVTLEQLHNMLRHGHLDRDQDLVWHESLPDWQPPTRIDGLVTGTFPSLAYPPGSPAAGAGPTLVRRVRRSRYGLMVGLGAGSLLPGIPGLALFIFYVLEVSSSSGDSGRVALAAAGGILLLIGALALLISAAVVFFIALYRAWVVIQPFGARTTPGLAVGLCFVPVFGHFWSFIALWGWSLDYTRAMKSHEGSHPDAPKATPGLFLSFCIVQAVALPFQLFMGFTREAYPILGLLLLSSLVLLAVAAFQVCSAVNYFAARPDTAART